MSENYERMIGEHSGVTVQQRKVLQHLIRSCQSRGAMVYMEIGVLFGGNFRRILQNLRERDFAYAFDLFEDFSGYTEPQTHGGNFCKLEELRGDLLRRGFRNFKLYKGDSAITVRQIKPVENAVVLIDGNHTYEAVQKDFEAVNEVVKSGFIMFHDTELRHSASPKMQYPGQFGVGRFLNYKIPEKSSWEFHSKVLNAAVYKKVIQ